VVVISAVMQVEGCTWGGGVLEGYKVTNVSMGFIMETLVVLIVLGLVIVVMIVVVIVVITFNIGVDAFESSVGGLVNCVFCSRVRVEKRSFTEQCYIQSCCELLQD